MGDRLLFLPAIKTDGIAGTRKASESPAAAATGAAGGQSLLSDFNGDGFGDLAIGAPYEDVLTGGSNNLDAGAVTVIYGSAFPPSLPTISNAMPLLRPAVRLSRRTTTWPSAYTMKVRAPLRAALQG